MPKEQKDRPEKDDTLDVVKKKLIQFQKENKVDIKSFIHFPQYAKGYLPPEVKLALDIIKNNNVQISLTLELQE